jgi:hypothetical protein
MRKMRKAFILRVEYFWKGAQELPQVAIWNVLPEHVQSNVVGDAKRNNILVKAYVTTDGDPIESRKLYCVCDGTLDPSIEQEYMVEQDANV